MPYIQIESGKLTDEQKTLLIKRNRSLCGNYEYSARVFYNYHYGIAR